MMTTSECVPGNNCLSQDLVQWAYQCLASHGYTVISETPERVLDTPWSQIVRFATSHGYVYLKQTPASLALEAPIIQLLRTHFHASVPIVIAHNPELHCFLMQDAGCSLREILKQHFDTGLFCKAIDQFTALQLAIADHVDVLLDIGVPDWRLDKLPDLYRALLVEKEILIEDGLSEIEVMQLSILFPTVSNLCEKLSNYSIKETMVQPDFNDNNTLIDARTECITIIDLGEIVISHPFFSWVNCLQQIKKHHGLTEKDKAYLLIKDACLKNYRTVGSQLQILDAFEMAEKLWFIYWSLANYRLRLACDKIKLMSFQMHGKLTGALKEFMTVC